MITGLTENKLFKVKTFDSDQPYKVGYNGVLDIYNDLDGNQIIKYEIDNIIYKTYYNNIINTKEALNSVEYTNYNVKINSDSSTQKNNGDLFDVKNYKNRTVRSFTTLDSETTIFRKYSKNLNINTPINNNSENYLGDTIVEVNGNSFNKFINKKIVKKERYVGFVTMPEVKSEILIERDELTVFERHQRLSEINNLAELETYRNGYYKLVNTI